MRQVLLCVLSAGSFVLLGLCPEQEDAEGDQARVLVVKMPLGTEASQMHDGAVLIPLKAEVRPESLGDCTSIPVVAGQALDAPAAVQMQFYTAERYAPDANSLPWRYWYPYGNGGYYGYGYKPFFGYYPHYYPYYGYYYVGVAYPYSYGSYYPYAGYGYYYYYR